MFSASCKGQSECSHFLAVSDYQHIANQYRVVPGLAFNCGEPCKFFELFRSRRNQRQFSFFRQHQQHILIGQQDKLASIASAFPFAIAFLNIDARQIRAFKAVNMTFVNDKVVKVGY